VSPLARSEKGVVTSGSAGVALRLCGSSVAGEIRKIKIGNSIVEICLNNDGRGGGMQVNPATCTLFKFIDTRDEGYLDCTSGEKKRKKKIDLVR
jgi:ribosome-binding protein aMBF1 (putative translation factor)